MSKSTTRLFFAALTCAFMTTLINNTLEAADEKLWVYFAGNGIHLYEFDLDSGALEPLSETQDAKPSFLAIHPSGDYLYGCGKTLSAFAIDSKTGALKLLNKQAYDKHGLCHLVVDKQGKNVLSAGYGSGTVVVRQINDDGSLGDETAMVKHKGSSVNEKRQQAPHAHSINLDPSNNFAFAADLGTDEVVVYKFDSSDGSIEPATPAKVQPGAGPRHFAFHPSGKFAYVINELDSTVVAFRYDDHSGQLTTIDTQTTLPDDFNGENYTAEVVVHPNGKFLYGSNRGHHSIAVFKINADSGKLTAIDHTPTGGEWPRNFCVDPTGQYLLAANQRTGNVVVFRIDQNTGKLTATEHVIEVPGPNCVRFLKPKS